MPITSSENGIRQYRKSTEKEKATEQGDRSEFAMESRVRLDMLQLSFAAVPATLAHPTGIQDRYVGRPLLLLAVHYLVVSVLNFHFKPYL